MTKNEIKQENAARFETLLANIAGVMESPTRLDFAAGGSPRGTSAPGELSDIITSRGVLDDAATKAESLLHMAEITRHSRPGSHAVIEYARMRLSSGFSTQWIRESMRGLGWVPASHAVFAEATGAGVELASFHRPFPDSVYFVTSNAMKLREMRAAVSHPHLHGCDFDIPELKHDDIETIADDKARRSYAIVRRPVLCTDGGIFMDAYDGFPGPNSKQAATKLKPDGLLRLLVGVENRNGSRRNAAAFYDGCEMTVQVSAVPVRFATEPRGTYPSYPMDKILIPVTKANAAGLTYAEMPPEERCRTQEVPALAKFLRRIAAAA